MENPVWKIYFCLCLICPYLLMLLLCLISASLANVGEVLPGSNNLTAIIQGRIYERPVAALTRSLKGQASLGAIGHVAVF